MRVLSHITPRALPVPAALLRRVKAWSMANLMISIKNLVHLVGHVSETRT
ncbi:hypothetical protein Z945_3679 [Sulfitobacter noctilucae]|nr:hypothetical protein [Sulfitobacter noctilucae]KIN70303.1 hypothetical protein Z945_3679 [Sulfitobacter noctilucae]